MLAEFTLVSEFDINEGATLRHAAPVIPLGVSGHSLAERMLPEGGHAAASTFTVFVVTPDAGSDEAAQAQKQPLVCVSVARTRLAPGTRRGAEMKAFGIVSAVGWVDLLRPLLMAALDAYFDAPVAATVTQLHDALNACVLPAPTTRLQRALMRGGIAWHYRSAADTGHPQSAPTRVSAVTAATRMDIATTRGEEHVEVSVALRPSDGWNALVRVPRALEPSASFHSASLLSLLTRFGAEGSALLFTAVVTGRRILFSGARGVSAGMCGSLPLSPRVASHPAVSAGGVPLSQSYVHSAVSISHVRPFFGVTGDVANCVLACLHLVVPGIASFDGARAGLLRRLYPHASLSDTSFLNTPAFIAGVTNPIFEAKVGTYDVLCVVGRSGSVGTGAFADPVAQYSTSLSAGGPRQLELGTTTPGSLARLSRRDRDADDAELSLAGSTSCGVQPSRGSDAVGASSEANVGSLPPTQPQLQTHSGNKRGVGMAVASAPAVQPTPSKITLADASSFWRAGRVAPASIVTQQPVSASTVRAVSANVAGKEVSGATDERSNDSVRPVDTAAVPAAAASPLLQTAAAAAAAVAPLQSHDTMSGVLAQKPHVDKHSTAGTSNSTATVEPPPYFHVDCAFFRRAIAGGLKFGEGWLRSIVEAYGMQLLLLLDEPLRQSHSSSASDDATTSASMLQPQLGRGQPLHSAATWTPGSRLSRLAAVNHGRLAAIASTQLWRDIVAATIADDALQASSGGGTGSSGGVAALDARKLRSLAHLLSGFAPPLPGSPIGALPLLPPSWRPTLGSADDEVLAAPIDEAGEAIDAHDKWQLQLKKSIVGAFGNAEASNASSLSAGVPHAAAAAAAARAPLEALHSTLRGSQRAQEYFVSLLPVAGGSGGLHAMASGALHADPHVRAYTVAIIRGLQRHENTYVQAAVSSGAQGLNPVVVRALDRHASLPARLGIQEL